MRETDVAALAATWLGSRGLTVHREVVTPWGRCDLVGRGHGEIHAVECKVRLARRVVAQAERWHARASFVWVATPDVWTARARPSLRAREECADLGIGSVRVGRGASVEWEAVPTLCKVPVLGVYLHPDQCTAGVAGSKDGGYSTRLSRTIAAVVDHLTECPDGATVRELRDATRAAGAIEFSGLWWRERFPALLRVEGKGRDRRLAGLGIEGRGKDAVVRFDGDVF